MVTTDSLERLGRIARAAGAAILEHYRRPGTVSFKADQSPLTEADQNAHHVIAAALLEWDQAVPVVSEEGEIPAYQHRLRWERFWLVDRLMVQKSFSTRTTSSRSTWLWWSGMLQCWGSSMRRRWICSMRQEAAWAPGSRSGAPGPCACIRARARPGPPW